MAVLRFCSLARKNPLQHAHLRELPRSLPLTVALRLLDRIYTGQPSRVTIARGTCAEIATGAPLPEGADAVVMVEQTVPAAGARVGIVTSASAGQHIGRRGADIAEGDLVVREGDWLSPSRVGAIAAIGCAGIDVYARPRVAILSTGNEVIDPGTPLKGGQIYDVNRFTLGAVVAQHGGEPLLQAPVPDTLEALTAALGRTGGADVVIFSGGARSASATW